MMTDALIDALARDVRPVRAGRWPRRFAMAALAGLALAGLVVWTLFGIREGDVLGAILAKCAYCLAAVAAFAPLAFVLSRPNIGARNLLVPAALFVLSSLAVAGLVIANTAPEARLSAWLAGGFPECLRRIPILATPVAVVLLFVVRGMSPTRLTLAGAALGGLAGAIAAVAYSWFCPVDSVAYVATWYLVSILLCAGIGAATGKWLLRW
jgi:hypothetical protein